MKIQELETLLDGRWEHKTNGETEIAAGFTSDLLSDVMGNAPEDSVLVTIQAHKNTIAVATLAGIVALVICSNRPIPEDMLAAAKQEGVAVLVTQHNQFEATGRIYARLQATREG